MDDANWFDEDAYDEVRARVIRNKHTRDDVLHLIDLVDKFEQILDEHESYAVEESEVNQEDSV